MMPAEPLPSGYFNFDPLFRLPAMGSDAGVFERSLDCAWPVRRPLLLRLFGHGLFDLIEQCKHAGLDRVQRAFRSGRLGRPGGEVAPHPASQILHELYCRWAVDAHERRGHIAHPQSQHLGGPPAGNDHGLQVVALDPREPFEGRDRRHGDPLGEFLSFACPAHTRQSDARHLIGLALIVALLSAAAAIVGVVAAWPRAASAHDWYPPACCRGSETGGDCAPIAASRVRETPSGYLLDGKLTKPYGETQWSPDGRFHACISKYDGALLCLFAPERGS